MASGNSYIEWFQNELLGGSDMARLLCLNQKQNEGGLSTFLEPLSVIPKQVTIGSTLDTLVTFLLAFIF